MAGTAAPELQKAEAPAERGSARFFSRRRVVKSPNEALQPEAAPPPPSGPPPSKRNPTLSAVSGFLSFLLVILLGCAGLFVTAQNEMTARGPLQADKVVYIAPRTEVVDIIDLLEKENVIDSPLFFKFALWSEGKWSSVRFGEYLFKQQASMREVMETLVSGRQILHSVTIPEGLTSEQIIQRLNQSEFLAGDVREIPREGVLLPETYRVSRGMSRNDLIKKMQDDQTRLVDQIWNRRAADLPLKSKYELITLASIVEKETGKADERSRIAGVFLNRLQKRMRLQSDPTIVYGLVGGKGTLGRGILRSELDKPTAYNTYVIEGLPPGPIANPGRAALEAVANPSRTKDLYFVADGTGGHAFAETLDQHNRNVVRWRQIEKEQKERANAPVGGVDRVPALDMPAPPTAAPPTAAPPPARNQRGELVEPDPTFGDLNRKFAAGNPELDPLAVASLTTLSHLEKAPVLALAEPPDLMNFSNLRNLPPLKPGKSPSSLANFSMGPGVEELGFSLAGVAPRARVLLDGPIDMAADEDSEIDTTVVPVSANRRAEQKAKALRYGATTGADSIPEDEPRGVSAFASVQPGSPNGKRILDASEGTPLDPLKNRTWDLNSAKSVPAGIAPAFR
jgi:UPF0755 protein